MNERIGMFLTKSGDMVFREGSQEFERNVFEHYRFVSAPGGNYWIGVAYAKAWEECSELFIYRTEDKDNFIARNVTPDLSMPLPDTLSLGPDSLTVLSSLEEIADHASVLLQQVFGLDVVREYFRQ